MSREATGSVPTVAAVKKLVSASAQKRDDVLKIRGGTRSCAESRRIQQATLAGKESEAEDAATDLEAPRADVLVWQSGRRRGGGCRTLAHRRAIRSVSCRWSRRRDSALSAPRRQRLSEAGRVVKAIPRPSPSNGG